MRRGSFRIKSEIWQVGLVGVVCVPIALVERLREPMQGSRISMVVYGFVEEFMRIVDVGRCVKMLFRKSVSWVVLALTEWQLRLVRRFLHVFADISRRSRVQFVM